LDLLFIWHLNLDLISCLLILRLATRQTSAPTIGDYTAVLRIFLYLVGIRSLGLCFHSGEGVVLYATVDASYANHLDRKLLTPINDTQNSKKILNVLKKV
jgi:hypothetical protein